MKKSLLTYISLFSSAGIGCYGFHEAAFECVATNEIIPRRMNIQKFNKKCEREAGYICGDIIEQDTKDRILNEVKWWRENKGVKDITVVVATPPCQGMSVANHKKNENDIYRNSLVVESLQMVKLLQPLFFVFENVPAFMDTMCIMTDETICSISDACHSILGRDYLFYDDVINFKYYGAQSSRTRALVIGVNRKLARFISPIELFPGREQEPILSTVIGHLPSLKSMGEICADDIYHSYRPYPEYMIPWIEKLSEGHSAFENWEPHRRPYKIDKDGNRIENVNKNGDKYTRQCWDRVGPTIHTRNDQLASQNTIHPSDNRVFSIRELMLMMSIPSSFRWADKEWPELNNLTEKEKRAFLKKEESNIRLCIGEAVPTQVFCKIAMNISSFMRSSRINDQQIKRIITANQLSITENLVNYISSSINCHEKEDGQSCINNATLSRIAELANTTRVENAAYYTEKETLTYIFEHLPNIDAEEIRILEPAVGTGNFIPFLVKKYASAKRLIIDVLDTDKNALDVLTQLLLVYELPDNVHVNILHADYLEMDFEAKHYHLIVGNPPYLKLHADKKLKNYRELFQDNVANNLAAFFLEKSFLYADYIAFVLPKNFLCNVEYCLCRDSIRKMRLEAIIDFGEHGFSGINIETIFLLINTRRKGGKVLVESVPRFERLHQIQRYICDPSLPNWVIFRNEEFDKILNEKKFGVFNIFRDRQITKSFSVKRSTVWVVKSQNIPRDGKSLLHLDNGKKDTRLNRAVLKDLGVYKYIDRDDVFLVPNMTYYPRMIRKPAGVVANGSVAILIPKEGVVVSDTDVNYIASDEFESFYRIARNHATRSLNIDSVSIYYFCTSQ